MRTTRIPRVSPGKQLVSPGEVRIAQVHGLRGGEGPDREEAEGGQDRGQGGQTPLTVRERCERDPDPETISFRQYSACVENVPSICICICTYMYVYMFIHIYICIYIYIYIYILSSLFVLISGSGSLVQCSVCSRRASRHGNIQSA